MKGGPPTSPSPKPHRAAVTVAPGELCASCHPPEAGHHIARSATTPTALVDSTTVDTAVSSSAASSSSTLMVVRLVGGSVRVLTIGAPFGRRYVMRTSAGWVDGLASSRNRSKNEPVAPSGRNHCVDVAVTPALAWPAANGWPGRE